MQDFSKVPPLNDRKTSLWVVGVGGAPPCGHLCLAGEKQVGQGGGQLPLAPGLSHVRHRERFRLVVKGHQLDDGGKLFDGATGQRARQVVEQDPEQFLPSTAPHSAPVGLTGQQALVNALNNKE